MIQISFPVFSQEGDLNLEEEKEVAEEIVRLREEINVLIENNSRLKERLEEERNTEDERISLLREKINELEDQKSDINTIKNYYMELCNALMEENKELKESLEEERLDNEEYIIELEKLDDTQSSTINDLKDVNTSLEIENTKLRIQSDVNKYLYFGLGAAIVYFILE